MPVVTGIERFRDAMAAHDDEYVLIGGGACSLLFDDAGMPFRATKDLDIVILTEADGGSAFARDFWAFIQSGGYMRADAEAFFKDFEQYIDRQTNRKQQRALEEDLAVLKRTYLGA